jgi:hypothetical protein
MNRWLGVILVILLLVLAWIAYDRPELFPGNTDVTGVIYMLMALLLVGGGLFGLRPTSLDRSMAIPSLLFWGGLILAIVFAYQWIN